MIRAEKTEYLRVRYNFSCGYCGITESEFGGTLTRDHFKPLTKGGRDSVDNMVYACADCNHSKGDYFSDMPDERLLHPLYDNVAEHLHRDGNGVYQASSALGAIYLRVLDLNRIRYL
ncbi:MAG: HNH endonuclease [Fibrella sp.]|nr:HNH endonuclease [Armatimonadota bacterium]